MADVNPFLTAIGQSLFTHRVFGIVGTTCQLSCQALNIFTTGRICLQQFQTHHHRYVKVCLLDNCIYAVHIDGHVCWNSNRRLPSIVCRPRQTNFRFPFPLAADKRKLAVSVFCFLGNKRKSPFFVRSILDVCVCVCVCVCMNIFIFIFYMMPFQTENGSPGDFLNPITVWSSCKGNFAVCLFVDKETNGKYPFANGLNGLMLWTDLPIYAVHTLQQEK